MLLFLNAFFIICEVIKSGNSELCSVCSDQISERISIINSEKCALIRKDRKKECRVKVYNPDLAKMAFKASMCVKSELQTKTFYYFFGSKVVQSRKTIISNISPQRCAEILNTKHDKTAGRLQFQSQGIYESRNIEKLRYIWLKQTVSITTNILLHEKVEIYFNAKSKRMYSPIADLSSCKVEDMNCITKKFTFIWKKDDSSTCRLIKEAQIFEGKALIMRDTSTNIRRLDIPDLTISFESFQEKGDFDMCFNQTSFETRSGLIIEPLNCSEELQHMNLIRKEIIRIVKSDDSVLSDILDSTVQAKVSDEMNFLYNVLENYIKKLETFINYMNCERLYDTSFIMKILATIEPSKTLSFLTNNKVRGFALGNTFAIGNCKELPCTIKNTLRLEDGGFALFPIAEIKINKIGHLIQINKGLDFWTLGVSKRVAKLPKETQFFTINDKILKFVNGSLQNETILAKNICPKQNLLHLNYSNLDFGILPVMLGHRKSILDEENLERSVLKFNEITPDFVMSNEIVYENGIKRETSTSKFFGILNRNPIFLVLEIIFQIMAHTWSLILTVIGIIIGRRLYLKRKKDNKMKHLKKIQAIKLNSKLNCDKVSTKYETTQV